MTKADFESAVREHQGMVYSIACNYFHNAATAEEIAQDVFLQLYESRTSVEPGGHCVAWLRRITVHRCIDLLRRSSFRNEVYMDVMPEVPVDAPETDPFLQDCVKRLVASLPEGPRSVVVLRFGEDMDPDEIGELLNMPVRTVWSHLRRATALMKEKAARYLKEDNNEPVRTRS
jgi:RNA polymerase sigma-70 factor (ECF subfamily)